MNGAIDTTYVLHIDVPMLFGDDACMPIDPAACIEFEIDTAEATHIDPTLCPHCGGEMRVLDSRNQRGCVRRRRQCIRCPTRTTTRETVSQITRNAAMPPAWAARNSLPASTEDAP